mmetsp:Transcript_19702/g.19802  ORF Transcript_19702/g.19802 Transcript_19702/m.19802 type:complete len:222 (-) Transcript_19702:48-713(-)
MVAGFVSGAFAATSSSSAFSGNALCARSSVQASASRGQMTMSMSKAIPFLEKPKNLDGSLAGDVGFDPLGFSDYYDVKFLREAELKHGRICMLAALGWVFPEFYHIPSPDGVFSETNPLAAVSKIPTFGLIQIVLGIAVLEAISWNKIYMTPERPAGDFGFDPLGLGKGSARARMELAEVKNGRLAMIAVGGFIHQALLTGKGVIAQLNSGDFAPTAFPLT